MRCNMDKVMVYYHKDSDTMDIWFGNPEDEVYARRQERVSSLKRIKMERPLVLKNSMSVKQLVWINNFL